MRPLKVLLRNNNGFIPNKRVKLKRVGSAERGVSTLLIKCKKVDYDEYKN